MSGGAAANASGRRRRSRRRRSRRNRSSARRRAFWLWALAVGLGLWGSLYAAAALVGPYTPPDRLPPGLPVELAARALTFALGASLVAVAWGLLRYRRWAFFAAVAWMSLALLRLLWVNLDPDRGALLVADPFGLLVVLILPFLLARRGRFLDADGKGGANRRETTASRGPGPASSDFHWPPEPGTPTMGGSE